MKKRLVVALTLAMAVSMFAACGQSAETTETEATEETTVEETPEETTEDTATTEASEETYEGDGWTLQYDPSVITPNANDDGSVVFAYYSEDFTPAGSNYMMISKYTDTDYETVLADKQKEVGATDAEITMTYFGADGVEAYSFIPSSDAAEESELQTTSSYTAIPVDSDVILIESFNTIEPEEENMYKISGSFETLAGTFSLTSSDSSSKYQTYEFDTYDGGKVVIDDSNIVSQESVDVSLEWDELPEDAEQLAPGRDFILFSSGDKYYVEDAANNLVTIANK